MKRSAYQQLKEWKESVKRKPLIVQGARQVGKTFLISEFGKKEYSNFIYLNFERDKGLELLFEKYLDPETIFRISPRNLVQSGDFINVPLYAVNILMNYIVR